MLALYVCWTVLLVGLAWFSWRNFKLAEQNYRAVQEFIDDPTPKGPSK